MTHQMPDAAAPRRRLLTLLRDALKSSSDVIVERGNLYGCDYCPFDAKSVEPRHQISNDPSEAHYNCPVLNKQVWGERPQCGESIAEMLIDFVEKELYTIKLACKHPEMQRTGSLDLMCPDCHTSWKRVEE